MVVANKAKIFFDADTKGITTPSVSNHFDASPPSSQVVTLDPLTMSTEFEVGWIGSDAGGSGIREVRVDYRVDGGAYQEWRVFGPNQPSDLFTLGVAGKTFGFRSIATDNVGNQESSPPADDTETTVGDPKPKNPTPSDGATDVSIATLLGWQPGIDDPRAFDGDGYDRPTHRDSGSHRWRHVRERVRTDPGRQP